MKTSPVEPAEPVEPDQPFEELRAAVDEATARLRDLPRSGDARFDELYERFSSQVRRLRQQLDGIEDTTARKARDAARMADEQVQAHPYAAIGIAAGVGALVGLLVSRRR